MQNLQMPGDNPQAREVIQKLLDGNQRFREARSSYRVYQQDVLHGLAAKQEPIAGILGCSDARVSPEIIFDQPLGAIFASRVPGNAATESALWMIDIAVLEFKVPVVMVVGHTGCLAVGQLLGDTPHDSYTPLRASVAKAVDRAREQNPDDLYAQAIVENVKQSVAELIAKSESLGAAVRNRETAVAGAIYDMPSGRVELV